MADFSISFLSEQKRDDLIKHHCWNPGCPIPLDDLAAVQVLHFDLKGEKQPGYIVIHKKLAESTLKIFEDLISIQFPIHQVKGMEHFDGSDIEAMNANNSSGFNGRKVLGTDNWSSHAYGAAIDINPLQNPYVIFDHDQSTASIYPKGGSHFLNRGIPAKGMVEPIVDIFKAYGFSEWGGNWSSPLDYHHFQIPWEKIHKL